MPTDSASGRIVALDGWRGISVLMVVTGHLLNERFGIARFATNDVGVLIFFAISGFIITKLAIGEHAKSGTFSISRFYARRGLRILPPFLFYLACVLVASAAGLIDQTYLGVLKASGFLCISSDVIPSIPCQWFVAHTSSLGYEELFYIAFPVIFATFARVPRATFVAVLLGLVTFTELRKALHLTESKVITTTVGYFVFICMGALAATFEPVLARFAKTRLGVALWVASALIVAARIAFLSIGATSASTIGQIESALSVVLRAIPFATSWLVIGSIYSGSRMFAFLSWRPLVWVGNISYSLYLWQQIFTAPPELYTVTSPLLIAPLMFAAAAASFYWIELPSRRIGQRLLAPVESDASPLATTKPVQLPP